MIEYINIEGFGEMSAARRSKTEFNIQAATSIGWGGKARVERGKRKLVALTTRINRSTHIDEQTDKDAFWQAVSIFQKENGIAMDGKLGAATWRKLLLVSGLPDEKAVIKWSGKRKNDPGTTAPPQKLPAVHNQPPIDSTLPIYTTPPLLVTPTLPRPPAPGMPQTPPSLRPPGAPATVIPGATTPQTSLPADATTQQAEVSDPWYKRTAILIAGGVGLLGLAVGGAVLYRRRKPSINGLPPIVTVNDVLDYLRKKPKEYRRIESAIRLDQELRDQMKSAKGHSKLIYSGSRLSLPRKVGMWLKRDLHEDFDLNVDEWEEVVKILMNE